MIVPSSVLIGALFVAQAGQPPATAPSATAPASAVPAEGQTSDLPVSLDRIRDALSHQPQIKPDAVQPVFRVEILGRKPTLEELLGKEFWKGPAKPTPGGAVMTHQEFLDMVTPPEFRGMSMFTQKEAITVVATSVALQWALQKAIHKYDQARTEREREAARKEVQDALAELDKAREAAGLPRR
jgi:hypothetical protein